MTRYWGWWLACLASLCLLLSLDLPVSIPHQNRFEWRHAAFPRQLRAPSWSEIRQLTSRALIRTRAGPAVSGEPLPVRDVFLNAENLRPGGPPWVEYRGPPDTYRDPGRPARLPVTLAAPNRGVNYASTLNFWSPDDPN